jgi:hypothetical protein
LGRVLEGAAVRRDGMVVTMHGVASGLNDLLATWAAKELPQCKK